MSNERLPGPVEEMIMNEIDDQENLDYVSIVCNANRWTNTESRRTLDGYTIRHGTRFLDPTYVPDTPQYNAMMIIRRYREKIIAAICREEREGHLRKAEYFKRHREDYTILSNIILRAYNHLRTVDDANSFMNDVYEVFDPLYRKSKIFHRCTFDGIFSMAKMIRFIKYFEKKQEQWKKAEKDKVLYKVQISKFIGMSEGKIPDFENFRKELPNLGLSESITRQFDVPQKRKTNLSKIRYYLRIKEDLYSIELERNRLAQREFFASMAALISFSNHEFYQDNDENCPLLPYVEIRKECTRIALSNEDRKIIIRTINRAIDNWYKRHPMMSDDLRILINSISKEDVANGYLGLHAAPGDYLSCMDLYWVTSVCDIYLTSIRTLDPNIYYGLQWREPSLVSKKDPQTYDEYIARYKKAMKIYQEDAAEESRPR